MRKFGFFLVLELLFAMQAMPVFAVKTNEEVLRELKIDSKSILLIDTDHQKVILTKDAEQKLPVASLTKIMTALVTLEKRQLDEKVTITHDMVSNLGDYIAIGLKEGQQVSIEDLLYATLLPSAADAAQALAISTGGSISGFADMMNQKATELKLKNTHFSNPVGMNGNNYSTAADFAVILQAALKNKTFTTIFQSYEYKLKTVSLTAEKTFSKRPLILGGKTGYTQLAGRCLASNTNLNGVNYVLITLGANPDSLNHIKDTEKIYQYVKETYIEQEILQKGDLIKTVEVTDSDQKTLDLKAEKGAKAILHKELSRKNLTYKYDGIEKITPEIELGSKLGVFSIYNGDEKLYETDVYLRDEIEFYDYPMIIAKFIGLGILGAGVLLGIIMAARGIVTRR